MRARFTCILILVAGCERPAKPDALEAEPVRKATQFSFDDALRVADETVNGFVRRAMRVCGTGNYEDFRLLWSAADEPLPRAEYEKGWQAVEEIRIEALEPVRLADGADHRQVYVLLARVSLDPENVISGDAPVRHVAFMLVPEEGGWRLAKPPRKMRDYVKSRLKSREDERAAPATEKEG